MLRCMTLILLAAFCSQAESVAPHPPVIRIKVPILAPPNATLSGPKDVQATVLGRETAPTITAMKTPADDLVLLLIMDLAGDVNLADRAKAAMSAEIAQLPSTTHVALLRAQDGPRVILDPTRDRPAVQAAIQALTVSGRAGLLDSVEMAATLGDAILAKSAVRLAVLYVTDSSVTNYREDFTNPVINSSDAGDLSRKFPEALIQEKIAKVDANLLRSQTPIFIVHINYQADRLSEAYLNGLRQMAMTTGAMTIVCRSNAEIATAIHEVLGSILGHYSVTLELPGAHRKPLEVRLAFPGFEGGAQGFGYRSRFAFRKR